MKKLFYLGIMHINVFAFILFLFNVSCDAQTGNFTYKQVPPSYLPSAADLTSYRATSDNAMGTAYDLTASLPKGFVKDGSVDYTSQLQMAINNNKNVVFPDFPVLTKGLILQSNSTVIFKPNSALVMMPTASGNYAILLVRQIQNVNIYFPVLKGERKKHLGSTGEWGMGISITGSSNVNVINPVVTDCWGDGIYIGKLGQSCSNINLYYPVLDNNRRNGISIVSVNGLNITHAVVSNTNGTAPMAAIDFEPNSNTDIIDNVTVDKPVTFNSKFGMILSLTQLPGALQKEVNININNHFDQGSYYGFCYSVLKDTYNGNPLAGNVKISNPVWKNNFKSLVYAGLYKYGPNIEFKNVLMQNDNNNGNKQDDPEKIKGYFMNLNKTNTNKITFH